MISCKKMTAELLPDAAPLINAFLSEDEYYLDSSGAYGDKGEEGVEDALRLFLDRAELGFVWIAYDGSVPVGVCVVCFAISTSIGGLVVKLDDVFVRTDKQGEGIGSAMLVQLKDELRRLNVRRIDLGVHVRNRPAIGFYKKHSFLPLGEERMSCMI